jgi:hypothetical protein
VEEEDFGPVEWKRRVEEFFIWKVEQTVAVSCSGSAVVKNVFEHHGVGSLGWPYVSVNGDCVGLMLDLSKGVPHSDDDLTEKLYCIQASDALAVLQSTGQNAVVMTYV